MFNNEIICLWQNGVTTVQPTSGNTSPEASSPKSPPITPSHNLPAVCSAVAPSINGAYRPEPYFNYASLPRRTTQHYSHHSRTLPRNINQLVPRYGREQAYLMRHQPQPPDRYVVPPFGMLGLGGVWQQYSGGSAREHGGGRILTSLATSYAITTSDSDDDPE